MAATATEPLRTGVLGVPVSVCADVFDAALALHQQGGGQIVTLNAEMTMAAKADPALGAAIAAAGLVIPDGAGVVWALGRQGYRVQRSPGIELARDLLAHAAAQGWKVALVGASPAVMDQLTLRLRRELPGLKLVLTAHGYSPPRPGQASSSSSWRPGRTWCWWPSGCRGRKPGFSSFRGGAAASGWAWAAALTCGLGSKKEPPLGWELYKLNGCTA